MEEMNVYSEKARREAKQGLWPEEIDGEIGMFCEDCGLTVWCYWRNVQSVEEGYGLQK